ncbi:hypothetical protein RDWZM_008292 [Blomia tropicalis]|uniref:NadR/Ttd14 AAA domain-containing protein n=1 Tax=Blomia tropicalis TaxID=40697 RepID=A0A9Q0RK79_BLOTA|nr:hypothetical protein RDWZM_008292 [Blomia tropicalis]
MSPDEEPEVNGHTTTTTNGSLPPPVANEYQLKRNSTTVPPVMQLDTLNPNEHIVYRLVLTGGPCSGKTTGQARLSTFFENLGWKVYRVPETATTLFSGGIRFPDMNQEQQDKFQENLIKVMIAMERTFFTLASGCEQNCLVICDRGIMDATAYMSKEIWDKFLKTNGWNAVELRDNRYNQIIHLVTSADGAEEYYNCEDNPCRTEGIDLARELDRRTMQAWVGHPYIDVLDNTTDFDTKIRKMIASVCRRIGIEANDRLNSSSKKLKFLVKGPLPLDTVFPSFQDFDVVHDYLVSSNFKVQSRLRKRGQNGNWSYQHTVRRSDDRPNSQQVELRRQISHRDYVTMLAQRDDAHHTIYKKRRCFLWQQTYFQLDIYQMSGNSRCSGLILLELYSTHSLDELKSKLPPFLTIVREVTDEKEYSMYQLSLKNEPNGSITNGKTNNENKSPIRGNSRSSSMVNGNFYSNSTFISVNGHSFVDPIDDKDIE